MMMKALALTSKGIEAVAAAEIKEILGVPAVPGEGCCTFSVKGITDLCTLAYTGQAVEEVLVLLDEGKVGSITEASARAAGPAWGQWIPDGAAFAVEAQVDEGSFCTSTELAGLLGKAILDNLEKKEGYRPKVDLKNPDRVVAVHLRGEMQFIGIEIANELNKRSYKLFGHRDALRGTIAYALLRMSGYHSGESLADPFCGSGVIVIEAAHYASRQPIQHFSKEKLLFRKLAPFDFLAADKRIKLGKQNIFGFDSEWLNLSNAKKNAKVAGLNKVLAFSRMDVRDIDLKFEKGAIQRIVGKVPEFSRNKAGAEIEKIYDDMFEMMEYSLSSEGTAAFIGADLSVLRRYAAVHGFKEERKHDVWSGRQKLEVILLRWDKVKASKKVAKADAASDKVSAETEKSG